MLLFFFFFNDTATTEIYTLSLHDALPIRAAVFRHSSLAVGVQGCGAKKSWRCRQKASIFGSVASFRSPINRAFSGTSRVRRNAVMSGTYTPLSDWFPFQGQNQRGVWPLVMRLSTICSLCRLPSLLYPFNRWGLRTPPPLGVPSFSW